MENGTPKKVVSQVTQINTSNNFTYPLHKRELETHQPSNKPEDWSVLSFKKGKEQQGRRSGPKGGGRRLGVGVGVNGG